MKRILGVFAVILVFSAFVFSLGFSVQPFFSTVNEGDSKYLIYQVTPVIDLDFFKIGLGVNTYQTEIGGDFYFGYPVAGIPDSTNIINGVALNFVEFDFDSIGAKYGFMDNYTFGLGTVLYRYSVPMSKAVDLRLGSKDGLNIQAHIPFEVSKWYPFEYRQSASAMWASTKLPVGPFSVSALGGTNMLSAAENTDYFGNAGAYMNLLAGLSVGGEAGVIMTQSATDSTFGYLAGAGAIWDLGMIRLRSLPVILISPEAVLGYVDWDYESGYNYAKLLSEEDTRFGGLTEFVFDFNDLVSASARYSYDIKGSFESLQNQKINADFSFNSPFEEYPFIINGMYRRNISDGNTILELKDGLFDSNTKAELVVSYPILEGLNVSYITYFDKIESGDPVFGNKVEFGAAYSF